jgi:hypothetical protein
MSGDPYGSASKWLWSSVMKTTMSGGRSFSAESGPAQNTASVLRSRVERVGAFFEIFIGRLFGLGGDWGTGE